VGLLLLVVMVRDLLLQVSSKAERVVTVLNLAAVAAELGLVVG
jgi:hypothetical protein